jgi:uncharacterized repeat protein (TIGR01451 family)
MAVVMALAVAATTVGVAMPGAWAPAAWGQPTEALTLAESFAVSSVPLGGTTTLTFTVTQTFPETLYGVSFTDNLPPGLQFQPASASSDCSGSLMAIATSVSLSVSGNLNLITECQISVTVVGVAAGSQVNTTSTITSAGTAPGAAATATLLVVAPPTLSKSFDPSSVPVNGTSTLTFKLTNPNDSLITGVGFSDTFPAGLVVAADPNLLFSGSANCNPPAGANAGSTMLTFPHTILDAGDSCTFSVNVTALTPGNLVNTTTAVTSAEGGNGAAATATLTVIGPTVTTIKVSSSNPGFGQPVTFTATVKPSGANGSGVEPTGTVSFYLNGSSTPIAVVPLSAKGKASFSTTGLGAGMETVTAAYSGDANFLPSSSSIGATTTVTCTRTITGTHAALVLAHGSTCVLDATITGSIIVRSGAALDLENSTVQGSVSATSGTTGFRMCGSSASSVTVENSTGFVVIGDPADGCATNVLNGSLTLIDNSGGVQAIGNFVAGAVTAINNTGAGPFPDDTAPNISGNGR